jgi:hypothetical protein
VVREVFDVSVDIRRGSPLSGDGPVETVL